MTVNRTIQIAPVRKSTVVVATPERAFEVFTSRIDNWWPKSHGIGAAPIRESVLEGFVGGRWYTTFEDGSQATVGHVLVWEPARRLVLSWEINEQWKPDPRMEMTSEVEVRFIAEGEGKTRVELEHRNFERMGAAAGGAMRSGVDGGWVGLLQLFSNAVNDGHSD